MKQIFRKKWLWITILFAVINIVGLVKIVSVMEGQGNTSILTMLQEKVKSLSWPFVKWGKDVKNFVGEQRFEITSIAPFTSGNETGVTIELNQEVDSNDIKGYIEVKPDIKFYIDSNYSGINLHGDFIPGSSYTVTVLKGMPSAKGEKLSADIQKSISIPDFEPKAYFKTPGLYMSASGNQTIPIESVNVDKLKFRIHKVYDNNVVYLLNNISGNNIPSDLGMDVIEKDLTISNEPNKLKETFINLKEILPAQTRGLFYLSISQSDEESNYYSQSSKLILTTDIGILAKQSSSELLVWLNSLAATTPIANATVKIFSKTNQMVCQGTSDENGMIHFKDVDFSGDKQPFVITATKDEDVSFLEIDRNVLSETDFDTQGRPYISNGYEAFLYMDRGIYRPGEQAHLRAIVRGKGVMLSESFPVSVTITRPDGKEFKKMSGVLSQMGTIDLDIDTPDYALTGGYEVNMLIPGNDKPIGSVKFNIEEFMPDSTKVTVKTAQDRFKLGDAIPLIVKAQESFGAPAIGRKVEVSYRLKPINFKPNGYKGFSFADETIEYTPKTIDVGEKDSDTDGQAFFEIELPKDIKSPSALSASIKTVVKEFGGHAVTNYTDKKVDPYSAYIGVRQQKDGFGLINEPIVFDYVTLSPDGQEMNAEGLKVKVCKIIWDNILKKDKKGDYRYITESREECLKEETIKPTGAKGTYSFTTNGWGDYIIRISGADSTAHTASLKFYVSGPDSDQAWAMDKPDRIELQFDKTKYAVGDTAKLVIKSPFKGKALISCTTDKVIYTQSVEQSDLTQEISIPVDQSFEPNAYCAVSVIRPVVYEKQWSSHRGFGIVPLFMDHTKKEVALSVGVPQKVEPGQKINLAIQAADVSEPLELSVALVDDGVLRLTDFKTPNPYAFFYGKRANNVLTSDIYALLVPEFADKKVGSDSAPSGDTAAYDTKHFNPINAKRVKPIALWQSNIMTDEHGNATVEFIVPDFTGTLKYMVVAAGKEDFGSADGEVKSISPIMITPTLPRFLAMNDQFIVSVGVFNSLGHDGKIFVSIDLSEGFEIIGEKMIGVDVKKDTESFVTFNLKAPATPQKGEIKISGVMEDKKIVRSFEIPVRPPVSWTTDSGVGEAQEGHKAVFKPSANNWVQGTGKYHFSIQSLPTLKLVGGLKFLLQYPYGCIEQTTSSVYPLLYLKNIAAKVDPRRFKPEAISNTINAGIERILSMQTFSGGFAWWPGDKNDYSWGSAYAVDFLVEADKAGYAVPQIQKTAGLNYLEKVLAGKEEDYPLDVKAYNVYVLAKAGRIKSSWIRKLQERSNDLPEFSRFHLAGVLALMGDKKSADEILKQGVSDTKVKNETGGNLNSYVRQQALALSIYLDVMPDSPQIPLLVKRLEGSMVNGHWGTTQENGMALIALGKYAKLMEEKEIDYKGSVLVDGKKVADFNSQDGLDLADMDMGGKEVSVDIIGKGSAYYYWSAEGIPITDKVEEKDSGIVIRRDFLSKEGKPVDLNKVKQGDVLVVDIALSANEYLQNVAIEDLLPAGFEIENPRIQTSETLDWIKEGAIEPDHMDIRDDRIVLFTDVNDKGHFRYIVRAVTKGDFVLPAVKAELMYNPNVYSVSGQGRVKVSE